MPNIDKRPFVWNSYNTTAGFPQPARFGRGVEDSRGGHRPEPGFSSHKVQNADLIYGRDEAFYDTTRADVLTPKTQAEVDAIVAQREADRIADETTDRVAREAVRDSIGTGNTSAALKTRLDEIALVMQLDGFVPE